jgi:hypothetical protein
MAVLRADRPKLAVALLLFTALVADVSGYPLP